MTTGNGFVFVGGVKFLFIFHTAKFSHRFPISLVLTNVTILTINMLISSKSPPNLHVTQYHLSWLALICFWVGPIILPFLDYHIIEPSRM